MKNARQFPRASINAASCLLVKQKAFRGKATNISPVGVFVIMEEPLPVGEQVYVSVQLPNYHGQVLSQAEVVWTCPKNSDCKTGVGLKFLDLSTADFFRVDNFVRHCDES